MLIPYSSNSNLHFIISNPEMQNIYLGQILLVIPDCLY